MRELLSATLLSAHASSIVRVSNTSFFDFIASLHTFLSEHKTQSLPSYTASSIAMKTFAVLVLIGFLASANAETVSSSSEGRALRAATSISASTVSSVVVSAISIGEDIASAVNATSSSKDCHQLACWIASPSYDCQFAAANQVQDDLTKGRNSFAVESSGDTGMWVRYWRTQFYPPDQGDIAAGTCSNGDAYTVTNCQATEGKVYC
jgi:hypothetical protein